MKNFGRIIIFAKFDSTLRKIIIYNMILFAPFDFAKIQKKG